MKTIERSSERILSSDIFEGERTYRKRLGEGTYEEPARKVPLYHRCDVLVVGGGPAGTAAAIAAARQGADVTLLERYNHLGGLSTGGLVIWIDRMSDWGGAPTIRGFAEDLFHRLPKDAVAGPARGEWGSQDPTRSAYWAQRTAAYHGVVTWSPTVDPERLKLLSQDMVLEHGVRLVFHSWGSLPIVEDGAVRGMVFESKEGRMAIRAQVVIDCTGDGDVFARAGTAFESDIEVDDVHHCMNTSWMFGGVDMTRWIEFKAGQPEQFSEFMRSGRQAIGLFERPFVSWRNDVALFMGPRQSGYSALNVDDLTEVEVRSHRLMARHLDFFKANAPGFENAFLMTSAPQIGVRHSRRLVGVGKMLRSQWATGVALPDEVGITPAVSPRFPNISIPYGALVPQQLDGLLAAGRHLSCDANSHGFMREIPQCWVTGQAAGTAAALAVSQGVEPRAVDIASLQQALLKQNVNLRAAGTQAVAAPFVAQAA
ncbi:FAD-dependent oxidoreductase [Pantoea sp. 18069]|uniref:FAD-dependent oxidoreductase n=1 Tax=Pantoea sp. 18069 TaxID=2681415 RepID=UPI00135BF02B|nr:FAD-dependent oxidoreductase [Pantoea sp. 18069]